MCLVTVLLLYLLLCGREMLLRLLLLTPLLALHFALRSLNLHGYGN